MKKIIYFISTLLISSAFLSCSGKPGVPEIPRTITVTGSNIMNAQPDSVKVTFAVNTTGWSAKNISADNETISNKLVDAIKAVGVSEEDITKSGIIISNPGNSYEAKRNIIANVRNTTLLGQVVDCKSASIKLVSVEYALSDTTSVIRQARTAAIQNAQDIASLLAGASGAKIGRAVKINFDKVDTKYEKDGKMSISNSVEVTFELL